MKLPKSCNECMFEKLVDQGQNDFYFTCTKMHYVFNPKHNPIFENINNITVKIRDIGRLPMCPLEKENKKKAKSLK